MRILTVSNLYPPDIAGGYEVSCGLAVDWLREHGHQVRVLTSTPRARPVAHQPHVLRRLELTDLWNRAQSDAEGPLATSLRWARAAWVNAHNVNELLNAVEEERPDLVYVWNLLGLGGLGMALAIQHSGIPWLWHLGDVIPRYLSSDRWFAVPAMARAFSRHLDGWWIASSQHVYDEIEDAGVEMHGPRHVISPRVAIPEEPLRRGWYRPGERTLRCVATGTMHAWKGTDVAIAALARLREQGCDVSLDLYGEDATGEFTTLVADLGLADAVRLRGFRPHREIVGMYTDYDVFLFPTASREPFGLAAMEAQVLGCVPLVTDDCGYCEWFVDGVHCLKAERTPDAFAAALRRVLDGEVSLEGVGRRGAAVARRDFDREVLMPRITAVLEAAAADGPHRPRVDPDVLQRLALYGELLALRLAEERAG